MKRLTLVCIGMLFILLACDDSEEQHPGDDADSGSDTGGTGGDTGGTGGDTGGTGSDTGGTGGDTGGDTGGTGGDTGDTSGDTDGPDDSRRVYVQGNQFRVNDKPIFMLGANTPWDRWNDFGHRFNYTSWDQEFQRLHDRGLNNTRIWITCSGENDSPGINASGQVTSPTPQFWADVEDLFEIAGRHEIYLMIALISFDHTSEQRNYQWWRNMYGSAANRQSFVDNYVIPFLNRFGDNPYFFAIDVGNELEWTFENHGVARDNVFDLIARVANAVHQHSEVLVTSGAGAGPKYLSPTFGDDQINYFSDARLGALQAGAYLDFYKIHYYDWMRQWFSTPFDESPASYGINDKPAIIGEYAANGHGAGYSPAECLSKAVALGWQGVQPWTSNGVDVNGTINDFGPAFQTWSNANDELVFP